MKLQEIIFYYLGAEVETPDGVKKMIYFDMESNEICCALETNGWNIYNLSDIKPILRKLDSLTGSEAYQLVKMYYDGYSMIGITEVTKHEIRFEVCYQTNTRRWRKEIQFHKLNAEQFTYLISLKIDLFNLIDQKLAIEKTEVNQ